MAVVAGNHGFLAIGDWLSSYREQLIEIFQPEKVWLPSYSTIRRVLLNIDYVEYSKRSPAFFAVTPVVGETIAVDGKVLRGSYQVASDHSTLEPHPAIMLVNAYIVESLKGNQSGLLSEVKANFLSEQQYKQINKGHGRVEKRTRQHLYHQGGHPRLAWLEDFDSSRITARNQR